MEHDSPEALAADIRAWLEWQKMCGTDMWEVKDWPSWLKLSQR